jgi:glycosyltransferase involved in cell wall biosynthesis
VKVLVVSGIWPPDVGGPATHAPEAADELAKRGHSVVVLTTATAEPAERSYPVRWVSRTLPPGVRHAAVAAQVARLSQQADVVYATSMVGRTAFAARAPLVVKVAGDPAFERSLRRGLFHGTLADFQSAELGSAASALRAWRTATARRAAHLVCPSEFLRSIVVGWGIPAGRVSVLPNATPEVHVESSRGALRASFDVEGRVLAFAGRLTPAKALDVAFDAVGRVPGVTLLVAGDGELRSELERRAGPQVRFLGALPRERVLELFAAADAALLSSSWENFPHTLVEALAVGAPAIATRVGGIPEIVEDGVNGLLVPPGDPDALAGAVQRYFGDAELRGRLRAQAAASVERFSPQRVFDQLEELLVRTVAA